MATPGDLVRIFADALRLPEARVGAYYRTLRQAGRVTKGGTGRSAPQSSIGDAATFLIALLGSEAGVDADQAILEFSAADAITEYGDYLYERIGLYEFSMKEFENLEFFSAVRLLLSSFDDIVAELDRHDLGKGNRVEVAAYPGNASADIRIGSTAVHFANQEFQEAYPTRSGLMVKRAVGEDALAAIVKGLSTPKQESGGGRARRP